MSDAEHCLSWVAGHVCDAVEYVTGGHWDHAAAAAQAAEDAAHALVEMAGGRYYAAEDGEREPEQLGLFGGAA